MSLVEFNEGSRPQGNTPTMNLSRVSLLRMRTSALSSRGFSAEKPRDEALRASYRLAERADT